MHYRCLVVLATTGLLSAADLPYAGKWKANLAKSDFGETTITYAEAGSGQMRYTADGLSYTFRMDGKDYPSLMGHTAAWKQINATTWESSMKLNGKLVATSASKLSEDGSKLTVTNKGPKPGGGSFDTTFIFQRVSGGPGLPGKWKTKNVNSSTPLVFDIAPSGQDGLTIGVDDYRATCSAKFDGKDYSFTGPTIPAGMTFAIRKTGPRSFEMTQKHNGKELYRDSFSVSPNGKILINTGSAIGVSEKYKIIYDRQ
ncbi:MAG: hypothetical protein ABFD86_11750 [Bryobacteraceae bacterium]